MKVLIADDNVDHVMTLAALLEADGFDVRSAHRAEDIVPLTRSFAPDVCLLDIGLPDFDGNELARRLRQQAQTSGAVLIAMTGYGRQQDRDASMAAGFDHYLVKPYEPSSLLKLLRFC
jgi:DNA-binding response OmpR family regulator